MRCVIHSAGAGETPSGFPDLKTLPGQSPDPELTIELLSGVNVDSEISTVPHQVRITDVMLNNTTSQYQHSRVLGLDSH